jgi:hypothetical protein
MRPKFTIARLLLFITCLAVTFAALKANSFLYVEILTTITVCALTTAGFVGWYSDGSRRAFWCAFAIVGWGYWLLVTLDVFSMFRTYLQIRWPLDALQRYIRPETFTYDAAGNIQFTPDGNIYYMYQQNARCIEALCLAALFGFLASYLAHKRDSRAAAAKKLPRAS